ncbi:MAG TPA: PIG-L deacetylase family protein, partial [Gammaproteobacteria bacterium]|nr:PIG-L deacetylase family protein [Gammaproteobacteria bacterium]
MKRLVCVFAHPDDEAMGPGGTIAKLAQEAEVYLICATAGNAGDSADSKALGKLRQEELRAAAKILGVKKVDFLGFDDGQLCNNLYHNLANKIEERVSDYQPETLLTFELNGVTGHLDHIAVSLATSFV